MKRRYPEAEVQTSICQVLPFIYEQYPGLDLIFHIPNQRGSRSAQDNARLKRMGVKAGIPDFFLPVRKGKYHGLFIEIKSQKGKLSDTQKEVISKINEQGYAVQVVKSVDDFLSMIDEYYKL